MLPKMMEIYGLQSFLVKMSTPMLVDGSDHALGISYLDLAEFINCSGSSVNEDLEELWRRIVLSISLSNVDDHLRNHGFILEETG